MKRHPEQKDIYNNVEMPIFYRVHSKKKFKIESVHYHSYIEIIYVLDGGSYVYVDDKGYELNKGDMIIINSGIPHDSTAIEKTTKELVVKFEPDTLYMSDAVESIVGFDLRLFYDYEKLEYQKSSLKFENFDVVIYNEEMQGKIPMNCSSLENKPSFEKKGQFVSASFKVKKAGEAKITYFFTLQCLQSSL